MIVSTGANAPSKKFEKSRVIGVRIFSYFIEL